MQPQRAEDLQQVDFPLQTVEVHLMMLLTKIWTVASHKLLQIAFIRQLELQINGRIYIIFRNLTPSKQPLKYKILFLFWRLEVLETLRVVFPSNL